MIQKLIKSIAVLALFTMAFTACTYDSEQDLYPSCNVGSNISYENQIKPILASSCMSCHSKATQNGGVNLEGHSQLKIYVTNGRFIGSIKHLAGFSMMPVGSEKLSDCNIQKIDKWIAEGALNN